jgi:hypothetical protein
MKLNFKIGEYPMDKKEFEDGFDISYVMKLTEDNKDLFIDNVLSLLENKIFYDKLTNIFWSGGVAFKIVESNASELSLIKSSIIEGNTLFSAEDKRTLPIPIHFKEVNKEKIKELLSEKILKISQNFIINI